MGKTGYKHLIYEDGVTKYYNKDFEVILYKNRKQEHAVIVDKRNVEKSIIYNDFKFIKTLAT
jgi:hypothetical protein